MDESEENYGDDNDVAEYKEEVTILETKEAEFLDTKEEETTTKPKSKVKIVLGAKTTSKYLIGAEIARILGVRAEEIMLSKNTAGIKINFDASDTAISIAIKELLQWKIPLVLVRFSPSKARIQIPLDREEFRLKIPSHFVFKDAK